MPRRAGKREKPPSASEGAPLIAVELATVSRVTAGDVRRLLEEHGIRPTKGLGQNFVADPNTVRRIVRLAGVEQGDEVIEVGAGLGSLTIALADAGARVVALEVDKRLVEILEDVVAGRAVTVVQADALRVHWDDVVRLARITEGPSDGHVPVAEMPAGKRPEDESPAGKRPEDESPAGKRPADGRPTVECSLVANLPYNVATPVVIRVLEDAPAIGKLLVMVQREVGERLAAQAGEQAYGATSVKVAYWATAEVVGRVPPTVFVPRPRVESVLVRIIRRPEPAVETALVDYQRLFQVVRAGFGQRRKMLRRALTGVVPFEAFAAAEVRPDARAEEVDLAGWARLAAWRGPR